MDDNVDSALSRSFVQLLAKARGKVEGVLPSHLAVYSSGVVCMAEMMPETLHVLQSRVFFTQKK